MREIYVLGSLALAALTLLTSCDKTGDAAILDKIERAKQNERFMPAEEKEIVVHKRPEDRLAEIEAGQRLVLFCAADLRDAVQANQLDILAATVPTLGGGLVFKHLDATGNASVQTTQLQAAQRAKPAVLIVQPVEVKLSGALLEDIREGGTVVFGLDGELAPNSCDKLAFVDRGKLGETAGKIVIEALRRRAKSDPAFAGAVRGRVVQLTTDEDSRAQLLESTGLLTALKTEPGVILVHDAPAMWKADGAAARIKEALALQGEFDVVVAQSDAIGRGASEALAQAGKREQVLIVAIGGMRGPDGGVELLRRAVIDAVVRNPLPMEKLYPELQKIAADPKYRPSSGHEELQPTSLTPKNVDDALRGR